MPRRRRKRSSRSSTSRKARSRARPMSYCRPWPAPRSASLRPRPSPRSSPSSPAFTVALARARGAISHNREAELVGVMTEIPSRASEVLNHDERIREIAAEIAEARDVLYLGRGSAYPLALEGALEAEGDLLHPRRRLCRRRDEARPDRPHRRERAGHRAGAARRSFRKDPRQCRGGHGPRRPRRDDLRRSRGRPARRPARLWRSRCRAATRSSPRSSTRSRSSSSPTTSPSSRAPTSTSPATWRKASRWSRGVS